MWYTLLHANTFICTPAHGGRAGNRGDRAPVLVRRYRPPVPEAPRQCRGAVDHHDGTRPAWHRSDGPPGHAGVAPTRPRGAPAPLLAPAHHRAPLRGGGLWHHSPRTFDTPTSRWPLALAAAVRGAQGLTPRLGSDDSRRVALRRLRVAWTRATPWLPRPAPASARKNNGATHCSRGPGPSRRGAWGGATQAGGVGWPSLPNLAGRRQKPRTSSRSCPPRQPIPIPRRSPGMACGGGRSRRRRPSRGGSGV